MSGFVFNIQRFSINDGPGIRSTVFVKGCNLHCLWCHNPESISKRQEIQYFEQKCTDCGNCVRVCPKGAHFYDNNGKKVFDRDKCNLCGKCVENCMYDALSFVGKQMSAQEVVQVIMKDADYYKNSGGGVTFSGGEPMLQKEFVREVFESTKALGLHNALDTAANVPWTHMEYVLPYVDLVLLDIKSMNSEVHKRATGIGNEQILKNAIKLSQKKVDIIVRIPIIVGINNSQQNISDTAEFLKDFKNLLKVELLPYHDFGTSKYVTLGIDSKTAVFQTPVKEEMEMLAGIFLMKGIKATI